MLLLKLSSSTGNNHTVNTELTNDFSEALKAIQTAIQRKLQIPFPEMIINLRYPGLLKDISNIMNKIDNIGSSYSNKIYNENLNNDCISIIKILDEKKILIENDTLPNDIKSLFEQGQQLFCNIKNQQSLLKSNAELVEVENRISMLKENTSRQIELDELLKNKADILKKQECIKQNFQDVKKYCKDDIKQYNIVKCNKKITCLKAISCVGCIVLFVRLSYMSYYKVRSLFMRHIMRLNRKAIRIILKKKATQIKNNRQLPYINNKQLPYTIIMQ